MQALKRKIYACTHALETHRCTLRKRSIQNRLALLNSPFTLIQKEKGERERVREGRGKEGERRRGEEDLEEEGK